MGQEKEKGIPAPTLGNRWIDTGRAWWIDTSDKAVNALGTHVHPLLIYSRYGEQETCWRIESIFICGKSICEPERYSDE
jgi:hypothetical protein